MAAARPSHRTQFSQRAKRRRQEIGAAEKKKRSAVLWRALGTSPSRSCWAYELLQYYAMERFLCRLSRSEHADGFVGGGGRLIMRVWSTYPSPQTASRLTLVQTGRSVLLEERPQRAGHVTGVAVPLVLHQVALHLVGRAHAVAEIPMGARWRWEFGKLNAPQEAHAEASELFCYDGAA